MKAPLNNPKLVAAASLKMLEQEYSVAWAVRDFEKCIHLLGKVLEINPRSANALLMMGRMHGVRYEYDEAIDWFHKAVEVSPKNQQVLVTIEAGRMARDFYDPTLAESFFQIALEESGTVAAKLALAEHSLRLRKREVAANLVDEILKSAPMDPLASLLWCRLHEESFGECVDRLKRLLTTRSDELRLKAGYQYAKMLDQAGDYDTAMRALAEAKAGLAQARQPLIEHRRRIRARFKELAAGFTAHKRDDWRAFSSQYDAPRKLALLGGHPRSGTTLLEQVLDSHPDIISAEETENFNIFAYSPLLRAHPRQTGILEVMDACSLESLKNARAAYFRAMEMCLEQPVGSRLLVDKNPSLTPLSPALFRLFPEMRFIAMIRDPRDVVLSCYMQPFFPVDAVSGNFLTLEDTAAEVGEFMAVWANLANRFEGNVCEVRYEEMVENVEKTARNVLGFLGMEWNEAVLRFDEHARGKIVRSPTADAVTEKVYTSAKARWKYYEKHLEPVFETLAPCLESLGYT